MWWGMVWCGVVWCGVLWCGVVWCGVLWCGVVWCGVASGCVYEDQLCKGLSKCFVGISQETQGNRDGNIKKVI